MRAPRGDNDPAAGSGGKARPVRASGRAHGSQVTLELRRFQRDRAPLPARTVRAGARPAAARSRGRSRSPAGAGRGGRERAR